MKKLVFILLVGLFLQSCIPTQYVVSTPPITSVKQKGDVEVRLNYGGNKFGSQLTISPFQNFFANLNLEHSFGIGGDLSLGHYFPIAKRWILRNSVGYSYTFLNRNGRLGEPPIKYVNRGSVKGTYDRWFSVSSMSYVAKKSELGLFFRPNYVHYQSLKHRLSHGTYIDDFTTAFRNDVVDLGAKHTWVLDCGLYFIRNSKKRHSLVSHLSYSISSTKVTSSSYNTHDYPDKGTWTNEVPFPNLKGLNFSVGILMKPFAPKAKDS